jgi:2-amino-4-hydroxy-6-hydroxymethyldihydropteridine diphosphokinase
LSYDGCVRAVLGIGSNLGDRLALIREAVAQMRAVASVLAVSPVYESDPLGPPQGRYLNAAMLVDTPLAPLALLAAMHEVERHLGRERRERWGARTLDLDVLWIQGAAVDDAALTVPHPALRERAFALRPLVDVAPLAVDPRDGQRLADLPRDDASLLVFGYA